MHAEGLHHAAMPETISKPLPMACFSPSEEFLRPETMGFFVREPWDIHGYIH